MPDDALLRMLPELADEGGEAALASLQEKAKQFVEASKAPATLAAYRADWRVFDSWCSAQERPSLPASPETVALWLADAASVYRPQTLQRKLAAIAKRHQAAGYASPCSLQHAAVAEVLAGIRRTYGVAAQSKTALAAADLARLLQVVPDTLAGVRDRALLLLGFTGAFRRSELAGLTVADLEDTGEGLMVRVRRSKTDQEGKGQRKTIPYLPDPATCPVRAVRRWRDRACIIEGALFRPINRHGQVGVQALTPHAVALIVKARCRAAGLDPARYAGHSLRSGFVTEAVRQGSPEHRIMQQTGHKSVATLRRYIQEADPFRDHPAARFRF